MTPLAERLAEAVQTLVGDGSIKQRLSQAYLEQLQDLHESELPVNLRAAFSELRVALNRLPPVGHENRVRMNVQKMSPHEAGRHAGTIVKLYVELAISRAEPLKVVTNGKKPPRYLTNRAG